MIKDRREKDTADIIGLMAVKNKRLILITSQVGL